NTLKYELKYLDSVLKLLHSTKNLVNLPSDDFFELANLFSNEECDEKKIDRVLKKVYTILAIEDNILKGIAIMDKDGSVGVFCVAEDQTQSKTCRLLQNALERYAVKKELTLITLLPVEQACLLFKQFGYEPFDGADEVNEFMLVKKLKNPIQLDLNCVQRINLDFHKPILVEGKTSFFPWFLLMLGSFFAVLYFILFITRFGSVYYYEHQSNYMILGMIIGIFFTVSIVQFVMYCIQIKKLKKEVLSMHITNGIVISHTSDSFWNLKGEHFYTKSYQSRVPTKTKHHVKYMYYDDEMQPCEGNFTHKYMGRGQYFYEGQELIIAFNEKRSYILRKYTIINKTSSNDSPQTFKDSEGNIKEHELSNYKPLYSAKMYFMYALSFFVMFMFALIIAFIFAYLLSKDLNVSFGNGFLHLLPLFIFAVLVLGIPSLCFFIFPLYYLKKFKKLLFDKDTKIYQGKLIHGDGKLQSKNGLKFYCEYQEGHEMKKIRVLRKFVAILVKKKRSSVYVLVNHSITMVLIEKGKYPDIISFFFPHY
nr:hypothetical protein [Anaeroplasmataceae bacterium]